MKRALLLLLALCCFPTLGHAVPRPCLGEFTLTGEWVYLSPMIDNPYYFIANEFSSSFLQQGPREAHEMDYHSGFKVEGLYESCDPHAMTLSLAWMRVHGEDGRSRFAAFLHPTQGNALAVPQEFTNAFAVSDRVMDLDRIEALVGVDLYRCITTTLSLEGGLQYARIMSEDLLNYASGSLIVDSRRRFRGAGPQLGLDFRVGFYQCFSVVGNVNGALLIGESLAKLQVRGPNPINTVNQEIWRIIPAIQMRGGLDWCFELLCLRWNLGVGYEFLTYMRSLDYIWFTIPATGVSMDVYSNADFHGPYAYVSLTY